MIPHAACETWSSFPFPALEGSNSHTPLFVSPLFFFLCHFLLFLLPVVDEMDKVGNTPDTHNINSTFLFIIPHHQTTKACADNTTITLCLHGCCCVVMLFWGVVSALGLLVFVFSFLYFFSPLFSLWSEPKNNSSAQCKEAKNQRWLERLFVSAEEGKGTLDKRIHCHGRGFLLGYASRRGGGG